jgi:hypothetical protein
LNNSPLFELDSIHVISTRRSDTLGFLQPMSRNLLDIIKESENADALISLEFYRMKDTISMGRENLDLVANRRVISHTVWRIYDLTRDTLFDEFMQEDTSDWYITGDNAMMLMHSLPDFLPALRTASYNAGFIYGQRISPYWLEVPRFYYLTGGEGMRKAGRLAAAEDWDEAAEIWKTLAYQDNENTAAKACLNMALVCELEDMLIPALDWAIKSYFIKQRPVTKAYIDQLKVRHARQSTVRAQLPAEE